MEVIIQRPYDWQTPLGELDKSLYTPNDVFFIRSHMGPPPSIDMQAWRLTIDGLVERPLTLTLDDIKRFPKHELPAIVQCSGNGRWYYGEAYPTVSHPAGAQWRMSGVGNARWGGARVRDVLAKAGIKAGAHYSTNFGLDNPILPATPKFMRGIELEKLLDDDTILAYEMNGTTLPYYHGYPLRLIVPGWAADHSVKWITNMSLTPQLTNAFWTSNAYRYPNTLPAPGEAVAATAEHPVTAFNVKSIITSPQVGTIARAAQPLMVSGFAWSGNGAYATRVEVSFDGGQTWRDATLGESLGKFSWRRFSAVLPRPRAGTVVLMARAHDNLGAVQPTTSPWNPGGYLWNGMEKIRIEVANA
jgi:sulfite oxidase